MRSNEAFTYFMDNMALECGYGSSTVGSWRHRLKNNVLTEQFIHKTLISNGFTVDNDTWEKPESDYLGLINKLKGSGLNPTFSKASVDHVINVNESDFDAIQKANIHDDSAISFDGNVLTLVFENGKNYLIIKHDNGKKRNININ